MGILFEPAETAKQVRRNGKKEIRNSEAEFEDSTAFDKADIPPTM